ncbi:hypothetical protein [Pseudotenacibaculum haliotis]|uniref:Uncharacterized protein n=1 Tax=Pseudotenacibaculum haliotis TaxID=1862138 RepID=A0ABW5LQ62_9FLAO
MKDLRKIIALFIFIFVVGTAITIASINNKLEQKNTIETVEISKDSTDSTQSKDNKDKKAV